MSRKKVKSYLPKIVHPDWLNCEAFEEPFIENIRSKLIMPTIPEPAQIFKPFNIPPGNIKLIIVNDTYPLAVPNETAFNVYPKSLKEMWQILKLELNWTNVNEHLTSDLCGIPETMILTLSLTKNQIDIWKPFMVRLFQWFNDCQHHYKICFLNNNAFQYAKYIKRQDVFYKFQPKSIMAAIRAHHNDYFYWGLPF